MKKQGTNNDAVIIQRRMEGRQMDDELEGIYKEVVVT
jgi:hypothetical protein